MRWLVALALGLTGCANAEVAAEPPDAAPLADAGYDAADVRNGPTILDSSPAVWSDEAGWLNPTYTRAQSVSITGASGTQSVLCDGRDTLILSGCGCAVNGGSVSSSGAVSSDGGPPNAWLCVGVPDDPVKGATIIAWVECNRSR